KGDRHEFVRFMKAFQDLDRGQLEPARQALEDLWRRRRDLHSLICTLDTGKAYVEALTWSGAHEQALEVAKGVLDYAAFQRRPGDYSEKPYDVAVSRDVMALLLAIPPEASRGVRDVPQALRLAETNVAYFPDDGRFHTTLGIAQYRAGRWDEAITTLS